MFLPFAAPTSTSDFRRGFAVQELIAKRGAAYNANVTAKTGICLVVLWFGSSLWAQEVRFLDFTSVQPRTQLRYPPPPPPDCSLPQSCVTGGSFGSSIADGAPDRRDLHALAVIPEKVVATNITLDPFQVEFRVLNTGLAPIDFPISPHLSDLQPADDSQPVTARMNPCPSLPLGSFFRSL